MSNFFNSSIDTINQSAALGEHIAKKYNCGTFPIDIHSIAIKNDIEIIPKDVKGVSGGIIFKSDKFNIPNTIIFYSNVHNNIGFERYSIAHELGHFFIKNHFYELQGGKHFSYHKDADSVLIEKEANAFAAGLLMPTDLVKRHFYKNNVDLDGIKSLAETSSCSLLASAIRTAQCIDDPVAIVVSKDTTIRYTFLSRGFKDLSYMDYPKQCSPLPQTMTCWFNQGKVGQEHEKTGSATLFDWFNGDAEVTLFEEIIKLPVLNQTLTVLTLDP